MDDTVFDRWTRQFTDSLTRRRLGGLALGTSALAMLGLAQNAEDATAKKKKKKGKKNKKKKKKNKKPPEPPQGACPAPQGACVGAGEMNSAGCPAGEVACCDGLSCAPASQSNGRPDRCVVDEGELCTSDYACPNFQECQDDVCVFVG